MEVNKERSLAISKIVDCYLNTQVNNLFDLAENMKALNNFQVKIDELQDMKDAAQIEYNGLALILLRKYVMEEMFGKQLMRNLIRQYYDLNDEQIIKYEKCVSFQSHRLNQVNGYFITNGLVVDRKGDSFELDGNKYRLYYDDSYGGYHSDILRNYKGMIGRSGSSFESNVNIGYDDIIKYSIFGARFFRRGKGPIVLKNPFIRWDDQRILEYISSRSIALNSLLENKGYIAWQGIDNIEQTLLHIQQLNNKNRTEEDRGYITDEVIKEKVEYYMNHIYELYSYLPLQESFVLEHQNELDWEVMELNPRIEWTFPLVQLILRKHAQLPEPEQLKGLKGNQGMFDKLFKPILNDDIIRDLEKLYGM